RERILNLGQQKPQGVGGGPSRSLCSQRPQGTLKLAILLRYFQGYKDLIADCSDIQPLEFIIAGKFGDVAEVRAGSAFRSQHGDDSIPVCRFIVNTFKVENKIGIADRGKIAECPREQVP